MFCAFDEDILEIEKTLLQIPSCETILASVFDDSEYRRIRQSHHFNCHG